MIISVACGFYGELIRGLSSPVQLKMQKSLGILTWILFARERLYFFFFFNKA